MARPRPLSGAAREAHKVARGATITHLKLRNRILAVVVVTLIVDVACGVAGYFLERHVKDTDIHTYGSAIFWTSTQLLTVSSQLKNPLSAGGRVLDVFMEAYAISVVATLAGAFGAFFHKRGMEDEAG
jgi:hypothetical protein